MIQIDDFIARHDNRDGYSIVDYEIVGLPVWRLEMLLQTMDASPITATEEFILKLIDSGINNLKNIGELLGLNEDIIISTGSDLIRMDAIISQNNKLSLTHKGTDILQKTSLTKPVERTVYITYDAILRKPKWFNNHQLFQKKHLNEDGVRTINASPNRKPEIDELNIHDIEDVIKDGVGYKKKSKVMRIKGIGARRVHYQKAIMLLYKSKLDDDIQVGFSIDRRISTEHEIEFARKNGPKRLGIDISEGKFNSESSTVQILGKNIGKKIDDTAIKNLEKTESISKSLSDIRGKINEVTSFDENISLSIDDKESNPELVKKLLREKELLEKKISNYDIRMVPVYEHPDYLWDALKTAKIRILIISPWITKAVVDYMFLKALRSKLESGVEIYIGYGLDERQDEKIVTPAEKSLKIEERNYSNLHLKRLGNTHAKILIKDDEYIITSSFNWLSFRGNPNRVFREEWGTYVGISETVNNQFDHFSKRIVQTKMKPKIVRKKLKLSK